MFDYLMTLLSGIAQALSKQPQSELDKYIASKNPQSAEELEMWIREYDRKGHDLFFGR